MLIPIVPDKSGIKSMAPVFGSTSGRAPPPPPPPPGVTTAPPSQTAARSMLLLLSLAILPVTALPPPVLLDTVALPLIPFWSLKLSTTTLLLHVATTLLISLHEIVLFASGPVPVIVKSPLHVAALADSVPRNAVLTIAAEIILNNFFTSFSFVLLRAYFHL